MPITEPDIIQTVMDVYNDLKKPWNKPQYEYDGIPEPAELYKLRRKNEEVFNNIDIHCVLENDSIYGTLSMCTHIHLYPHETRTQTIRYFTKVMRYILPHNPSKLSILVKAVKNGFIIIRPVKPKSYQKIGFFKRLLKKLSKGNI